MPSVCKVNGLRQREYFLVVIKKGQTGPVHMKNTKNSHHKSDKAFMLINTMRENHISSPTFFLITVIISQRRILNKDYLPISISYVRRFR